MISKFPIERTAGNVPNPAINLFGNRFFRDQTNIELMTELLLVANAGKKVGEHYFPEDEKLPSLQFLREWKDEKPLEYRIKSRLNLKLFAFLGASKLETRHEIHRDHYKVLIKKMRDAISGEDNIPTTKKLQIIENILLGFQGAGGQRTWCAQSFMPVSSSLLAGETIWNISTAKREGVDYWDKITSKFLYFFSVNRHRFLARGGELLYLQLCNALKQSEQDVKNWLRQEFDFGISEGEQSPDRIHRDLERTFQKLTGSAPKAMDELIEFIDKGVDHKTSDRTDNRNNPYSKCEWCSAGSWKEAWLFAIELSRIGLAEMDPIERLKLCETACAMHVLRSLCAQSSRVILEGWVEESPLGYVWAASSPAGNDLPIKKISQRSVKRVERLLYDAIRIPEISAIVKKNQEEQRNRGKKVTNYYAEADKKYGHKLFLTVSKRLGLVVPKNGGGARFVMNEKILSFLVASLVRPGGRMTYESFKKQVFYHYGIALDGEKLGIASRWSGQRHMTTIAGNPDAWMLRMLDEAGVLIRLSDNDSIVINPYQREAGFE